MSGGSTVADVSTEVLADVVADVLVELDVLGALELATTGASEVGVADVVGRLGAPEPEQLASSMVSAMPPAPTAARKREFRKVLSWFRDTPRRR